MPASPGHPPPRPARLRAPKRRRWPKYPRWPTGAEVDADAGAGRKTESEPERESEVETGTEVGGEEDPSGEVGGAGLPRESVGAAGWVGLSDLLGLWLLAGIALGHRPRIAVIDELSERLLALTDAAGLRAGRGQAKAPAGIPGYTPAGRWTRPIRAPPGSSRSFPGCRARPIRCDLGHTIPVAVGADQPTSAGNVKLVACETALLPALPAQSCSAVDREAPNA